MFMFKQLQNHAPCYASLKDDGAPFVCAECGERKNGTEMYYLFCPDFVHNAVVCKECIDEDWKQRAKDFSHIAV